MISSLTLLAAAMENGFLQALKMSVACLGIHGLLNPIQTFATIECCAVSGQIVQAHLPTDKY